LRWRKDQKKKRLRRRAQGLRKRQGVQALLPASQQEKDLPAIKKS